VTNEASLHDWIFNSEVDPMTRRRRYPFSSTLVLTGFNVLEGLGVARFAGLERWAMTKRNV